LQNAGTGNFIYGGTVPNFNVPDMRTATSATNKVITSYSGIAAPYLTYIIKI